MAKRRDWQAIVARLRAAPERWVLVFPSSSTRLVRYVRQRRTVFLRLRDGRIEAMALNTHWSGSNRHGDIWLKFTPTDRINTHQ